MRYTEEQLIKMAEPHLVRTVRIFACSDGNFFSENNKNHCITHAERNGLEYFEIKKGAHKKALSDRIKKSISEKAVSEKSKEVTPVLEAEKEPELKAKEEENKPVEKKTIGRKTISKRKK
jgi:hypothetical protein